MSVVRGAVLSTAQLRDPAPPAVRLVARTRLQSMLAAAAPLAVRGGLERPAGLPAPPEEDEAEAVHDFRVALRRLRSWLRAFPGCLEGTVRPDAQRRLRAVSRLAGRVRDLEVQHEWLNRRHAGPASGAAARIDDDVTRELARVRPKMATSLRVSLFGAGVQLAADLQYSRIIPQSICADQRMAAALADALRRERDTLLRWLPRVVRPTQIEEAHATRIAVKRLRYLLESVASASRIAARIVPDLANLQHVFGELHDAQMLQRRLRASAPSGVSVRALRKLSARRIAASFRQVRLASRSRTTHAMFTRLSTLIRRLERIGGRTAARRA